MKARRKKTRKASRWLISFAILIGSLSFLYFLWMPDLARLKKENPRKTAFMKYRERESKEKRKKYRINQTWVPLSKVSPYLVKTVLIAEDDKFWMHEGFDLDAIQEAIERDLKARKFKLGGSTISQQLARNLYLSPEKSLIRKFSEAILTWRMEQVLSKRRILELYLNVVEWGEGIFGAEAASRYYFGKTSSELTPEEAVRLAAVLPNPRRYNPVGNQAYVKNRSDLIYKIMIRRGIIIPEYNEATAEESSPGLEKDDARPDTGVTVE